MALSYQVLRNNRQTGPYTLDELRSLQLQDHDLIWVEGQAGGWRYPADVPELSGKKGVDGPRSTVHGTETTVEDGDAVEQKAARLHARMQAFMEEQDKKEAAEEEGEPHTRYVRSLDQLRQDYADWLHQKHRKKMSTRVPAVLLIGIILFCSGFLASRWYYSNGQSAPDVRLSAEEQERLRPQPAILTEIVPVPRAAYGDTAVGSGQSAVRSKESGVGSREYEVGRRESGAAWRSQKLKQAKLQTATPELREEKRAGPKPKAQPQDTAKPTIADLVNKYTGYKVMQR